MLLLYYVIQMKQHHLLIIKNQIQQKSIRCIFNCHKQYYRVRDFVWIKTSKLILFVFLAMSFVYVDPKIISSLLTTLMLIDTTENQASIENVTSNLIG